MSLNHRPREKSIFRVIHTAKKWKTCLKPRGNLVGIDYWSVSVLVTERILDNRLIESKVSVTRILNLLFYTLEYFSM